MRVLFFSIVISIASGITFGLIPAMQSSRPNVVSALKQSGRSATVGHAQSRVLRGVLVANVALAVLLVTGAGLMIRSLIEVRQSRLGFDSENLLTFRVNLPETKYSTPDRQIQFFKQSLERIGTVPGVRAASVVRCPPMAGPCWGSSYVLADRPLPSPSEVPQFDSNVVALDYFRTMGVRMIKGRQFTEADDAKAPLVVIINETLAKRLWPSEDPIGKRIKRGAPDDNSPYREIVGVVDDVKRDSLDAKQQPEVFMPLAQEPLAIATFVVRTSKDPMSEASAVAREIHQVDKDQPLVALQPVTQTISESVALRNFSTLLLSLFGVLALSLAGIGIFGVMAYTVGLRIQEMGIRMALGARRSHVFRLVLRQGVTLAFIGLVAGLLSAIVMTKFMASLLFGIAASDPVTMCAVSLVLITVAAVASYFPARSATKADPTVALRYE